MPRSLLCPGHLAAPCRMGLAMSLVGTVLVVDDQASSLEAMTDALRPLGFDVLQAADGATGLKLAKESQPDVILLDIMMPGMDGYEVCRQLKADQDTRLLPVVFLTGLDSRQARLQGLETGATDFLSKPFDLVELEVRVRNLVTFRHLTQDLDEAEKIIFSVARAVEARDEGTGDHCERLSRLAAMLGSELGLDGDSVKALRRAGYLHDIGKVGIPDAVLLKPGRLTEEEWVVMRSHVEIGVRICSPLRTLKPVVPIIRHHHERLDGSGYPDHLQGDEVPVLARAFQVVDVFDALTNDRPYRKAMTREAGVEVLRDEARRGWWDSTVVEKFAEAISSQPNEM
jgi:putative two-component system response regulator